MGQASQNEQEVPVLLLVGGLGTRLQSVLPNSPKPLAPLGSTPFLRLLVEQLSSQGFRHLIMCTGHLAAQIEQEFGDGGQMDVVIDYSRESNPLGTAGAVKLAERYLSGAPEFVVMNGDSFLEVDFAQLLRFHRDHGGMASMAARRVPDAARYGTLEVDDQLRVTAFREKTGERAPGLINGGVYVFNRELLRYIPDGVPASLEQDIFKRVLRHGVYASEQQGIFIDIGTPEDYARAQTLYESLQTAARVKASQKASGIADTFI